MVHRTFSRVLAGNYIRVKPAVEITAYYYYFIVIKDIENITGGLTSTVVQGHTKC